MSVRPSQTPNPCGELGGGAPCAGVRAYSLPWRPRRKVFPAPHAVAASLCPHSFAFPASLRQPGAPHFPVSPACHPVIRLPPPRTLPGSPTPSLPRPHEPTNLACLFHPPPCAHPPSPHTPSHSALLPSPSDLWAPPHPLISMPSPAFTPYPPPSSLNEAGWRAPISHTHKMHVSPTLSHKPPPSAWWHLSSCLFWRLRPSSSQLPHSRQPLGREDTVASLHFVPRQEGSHLGLAAPEVAPGRGCRLEPEPLIGACWSPASQSLSWALLPELPSGHQGHKLRGVTLSSAR